jgi:hypothetical protein
VAGLDEWSELIPHQLACFFDERGKRLGFRNAGAVSKPFMTGVEKSNVITSG